MTAVLTPSGPRHDEAAHETGAAARSEKGGNMATAALALNTWRVQFYETMAAAERARLDVRIKKETSGINLYDRFWLVLPLSLLLYFMKVLLTRLAALEAQPSSFLLERDAAKMPQSLSELFRKMCDLLQKAHEEALHRSRLLGRHIAALEKFTHVVFMTQ